MSAVEPMPGGIPWANLQRGFVEDDASISVDSSRLDLIRLIRLGDGLGSAERWVFAVKSEDALWGPAAPFT